jgi:lysophospholipase L1-like esterase
MTYPATLPNVIAWMDGRQQAYSDTGAAVLAMPYAGRVRRIDYPSPLSGNALAASDAARPWREPNALNFQLGATHQLALSASSAAALNDLTVAIAFRPRDLNSSGALGTISNLSGGFTLRIYNDNIVWVYFNTGSWEVAPSGSPTAYAKVPAGASGLITIRTTPTGLKASVVVNGVRTDYTKAVSLPATALLNTAWLLGSEDSATRTHAVFSQAIAVARSISDVENDALLTWLAANPAPDFPTTQPLVLVSGDSIAFGYNLARQSCWAFQAQQSINTATPAQPINLINVAVSGDTIALQEEDYATKMSQFLNPSRAKNIFLAAVGTNNIWNAGQDGPTALANYYAYLDSKLALGWAPIACTILPRTADANFVTRRSYFNTHLRAEWAARGYAAIADVALIPGMGADGDDLNLTNYMDGVHPTLVGNGLLEPVYRAAIQAAIGSSGGGEGGGGGSSGTTLVLRRQYDGLRNPPTYLFTLPDN